LAEFALKSESLMIKFESLSTLMAPAFDSAELSEKTQFRHSKELEVRMRAPAFLEEELLENLA